MNVRERCTWAGYRKGALQLWTPVYAHLNTSTHGYSHHPHPPTHPPTHTHCSLSTHVRGGGWRVLASPLTAFSRPMRPAAAAEAASPAAPCVPVCAPLCDGRAAAVEAVQVARQEIAAGVWLRPQEGLPSCFRVNRHLLRRCRPVPRCPPSAPGPGQLGRRVRAPAHTHCPASHHCPYPNTTPPSPSPRRATWSAPRPLG